MIKTSLIGAAFAVTAFIGIVGSPAIVAAETKVATFAGGCFWCIESDFDKIDGVVETISGYTGGHTDKPTYQMVTAGGSGHYEALRITYDPAVVSYDSLLEAFFHSVDPVDDGGQFCDRGHSYKTAIFVDSPEDRSKAETSLAIAEKELGEKIVTPIIDATPFFAAEKYHQNYAKLNPVRYKYYRWSCGRNQRVKELWGEMAYKGIPGDH